MPFGVFNDINLISHLFYFFILAVLFLHISNFSLLHVNRELSDHVWFFCLFFKSLFANANQSLY